MIRLLALFSFIFSSLAFSAALPFPYATRTSDYSAWTPASRGDINTIGMGGATLAVPSSISAAEANPAGFAVQTGSVSAQINRISIDDRQVQRSGDSIRTSQGGLGVSPSPWGFSLAYYSPITESGDYLSPITGHRLASEVSLQEFRVTVARHFFEGKLAWGLSGEMVRAVRELGEDSFNAWGPSFRVGMLYQMPEHLFLGATLAPEVMVGPSSELSPSPELPGFDRALVRPWQVGLGAGWVPNRFFRLGLSLSQVGATRNTALLGDQTVTTGSRPTLVPRAGLSYVLAEYAHLKVEGAVGSYYELSRLGGRPDRLHVTAGLEANPYFVNLGAGFDLSRDYQNWMLSAGIDIVRTARTFAIIPADPVPPYKGVLPPVREIISDGLPEGMTEGEPKEHAAPDVKDVGKIIKEVPSNVVNKLSGQPTSVEKKLPP